MRVQTAAPSFGQLRPRICGAEARDKRGAYTQAAVPLGEPVSGPANHPPQPRDSENPSATGLKPAPQAGFRHF